MDDSGASQVDPRQDGDRNCADPQYALPAEELEVIAAADAGGDDRTRAILVALASESPGPREEDREWIPEQVQESIVYRVVPPGPDFYYREPRDYGHRNYCGPGATLVALFGAIRDSSRVRNETWFFDNIGEAEDINTAWGIYIHEIKPLLNTHAAVDKYLYGGASGGQTNFMNRLINSIYCGYSMVTGVYTHGMPGWPYATNHIVTVYGYAYDTSVGAVIRVYWVDTAHPDNTRYSGPYKSGADPATFWRYVSPNDAQVYSPHFCG